MQNTHAAVRAVPGAVVASGKRLSGTLPCPGAWFDHCVVFRDVSNWFGLAVGAACLLEALLFALLRRRGSKRLSRRQRSWPMLICLGVMLTVGSAAHMRGWTGAGLTVVFAVTVIAAVGAIVFALRALADRPAEGS